MASLGNAGDWIGCGDCGPVVRAPTPSHQQRTVIRRLRAWQGFVDDETYFRCRQMKQSETRYDFYYSDPQEHLSHEFIYNFDHAINYTYTLGETSALEWTVASYSLSDHHEKLHGVPASDWENSGTWCQRKLGPYYRSEIDLETRNLIGAGPSYDKVLAEEWTETTQSVEYRDRPPAVDVCHAENVDAVTTSGSSSTPSVLTLDSNSPIYIPVAVMDNNRRAGSVTTSLYGGGARVREAEDVLSVPVGPEDVLAAAVADLDIDGVWEADDDAVSSGDISFWWLGDWLYEIKGTAEQGRMRWQVPNSHTGSWYAIRYDILRKDLETDETEVFGSGEVEWVGPGNQSEPFGETWFTDWVELPDPEFGFEYRLSLTGYKSYHSSAWTAA